MSDNGKKRPAETPHERAGERSDETERRTSAATEDAKQTGDPPSGRHNPLTIVGIGASAGGLEAFSQLLNQLPADTGLAFVFVQHLASHHQSALPHLLSSATKMAVVQAEQDMRLEGNTVYVIPPGVQLEIDDGRLHLTPRPEHDGVFMPVDTFFHSLASYAQEHAVGVVLSGTASDGAGGLREIKAQGGITLAQSPHSAKYDGMPRAAIATGAVDMALPIPELARQLTQLSRHPFFRHRKPRRAGEELPVDEQQLAEIFNHLRSLAGVDFTHYKPGTIKRRLQRRMLLNRLSDAQSYLKYLRENPAEVEALYQDVLIHVTRFFREPESFQALRELVLPRILERRPEIIRVWVPGCSTGEEAYSVAILLLETLDDRTDNTVIQIFGTDVSEKAIEQARRGLFTENIVTDVGEERLRRYFNKTDGHYRIAKSVRDLCVFARQDITRDPPFSNLDLILCRNVLIYLGSSLQQKVLGIFHYALRPEGFLMLASAESVGAQNELFSATDKKQRIFAKRPVHTPPVNFPLEYGPRRTSAGRGRSRPPEPGPYQEAERLLLDAYAPAAVIVNEDLRIVHTRGKTGFYLELAAGDPDLNALKMARHGLLHGLRSTLHTAQRDNQPARKEGLKVTFNGHARVVDVAVYPLMLQAVRHFLIAFEDTTEQQPTAAHETTPEQAAEAGSDPACAEHIRQLQQELEANRDYLQSTIQDLEAANEELQSANEEILSSNEELQSTNEELDTAKEELQSTNEELNTVNEELNARNDELSLANSDLVNLLASVDIAIVMISLELRIRRFTPRAEQLFNLIKSDVDRPLSHVRPNIDCPDLTELIAGVMDHLEPLEREVRDLQGRWYSLRIRPYKNLENRIDGAVLTLVDIDTNKRQAMELQEVHRYSKAILQCVNQPILMLYGNLRVRLANQCFLRKFHVTLEETEGRLIHELGNGQWDIPELRELLEKVLPQCKAMDEYRVEHEFPTIGRRVMSLCARAIENEEDGIGLILLAITDITSTEM